MLIKCPECGKEISNKAVSCPYCGCPASAFPETKAARECLIEEKYLKKYQQFNFYPALFKHYDPKAEKYLLGDLSIAGCTLITAELNKETARLNVEYAQARGQSAEKKIQIYKKRSEELANLVERYKNTCFMQSDQ